MTPSSPGVSERMSRVRRRDTAPELELRSELHRRGFRYRVDRRSRSVATLAALVALGADNEIPLHVRGALRNGLSPDEIKEVILHSAVYAGVPRANSAFAIAQKVLAEERDAE